MERGSYVIRMEMFLKELLLMEGKMVLESSIMPLDGCMKARKQSSLSFSSSYLYLLFLPLPLPPPLPPLGRKSIFINLYNTLPGEWKNGEKIGSGTFYFAGDAVTEKVPSFVPCAHSNCLYLTKGEKGILFKEEDLLGIDRHVAQLSSDQCSSIHLTTKLVLKPCQNIIEKYRYVLFSFCPWTTQSIQTSFKKGLFSLGLLETFPMMLSHLSLVSWGKWMPTPLFKPEKVFAVDLHSYFRFI